MIAIKNMEMPKSCSECSFKASDYVCGPLDCVFSCNHFKERNYNCPLVQVEEHKVGKWIKYNTTEKLDMFGDRVKVSSYKCSECGRTISDINEDGFTNKLQDYPYCHCGAKMEGGGNE